MTVTVNLWQLLGAAAGGVMGLLALMLPAVYWAVKTAIRAEVQELELRITKDYMTKASCTAIRADCERHRHEAAELLGLPRVKVGGGKS